MRTIYGTDGAPVEMTDGDFIRNPDLWPVWPRLPVKRYAPGSHHAEMGVVLDESGGLDGPLPEPVRVYLGNLYDDAIQHREYLRYETVDDMLGAGWEVD
jgi:hypothetical protein